MRFHTPFAPTPLDSALREMTARHEAYAKRMKAWYAERRRTADALAPTRWMRADSMRFLLQQEQQDRAERLAWEKADRAAITARFG